MKHSNILLLAGLGLAISTFTSCKPEETTNTTPETKITNVATTKVISYDSIGQPTDTISYTFSYDAQNRLLKKLGSDGSEEQYAYSATTAAITFVDPTDPTANMTLNYTLDAKGRLSSAPLNFSGIPVGTIYHTYNTNDQLATTSVLISFIKDTTITDYTWSNNNNITETDNGGSVTNRTFDLGKKEYRNMGIEDISRTRNANVITREDVTNSGQTSSNTYEYEYDASGKVIKETVKVDGVISSVTIYTY